jgi:hypothetical protein
MHLNVDTFWCAVFALCSVAAIYLAATEDRTEHGDIYTGEDQGQI